MIHFGYGVVGFVVQNKITMFYTITVLVKWNLYIAAMLKYGGTRKK
jgi:hypothetical protein